jgi:hypothetical protein
VPEMAFIDRTSCEIEFVVFAIFFQLQNYCFGTLAEVLELWGFHLVARTLRQS